MELPQRRENRSNMSFRANTIALPDVVGSVLDASSGVTATSRLSLLDGKAVLIGTNKGNVLFCTASTDAADLLEPTEDITLHCGPVYDMALSSQRLIASAGHDAVSCVFPLHALFSKGGPARCRRLTGHTVPVVAVKFLSDGTSLVSLAADGQARVVDVVRGNVLAVVPTGIAATCLACSVDETLLFVGGRSLVAVDLYHAMRPTSLQSASAVAVWKPVASNRGSGDTVAVAEAAHTSACMRLYEWASPASPLKGPNTVSGKTMTVHNVETPHDVIIATLSVDSNDNTLTAVFACGISEGTDVRPCGEARWFAGGGRTADQTVWTLSQDKSVEEQQPQQRGLQNFSPHHQKSIKSMSLRCRVKSATRPAAKQHLISSNTTNPTAALWHGHWYSSPFELSGHAGAERVAKQPLARGATPVTLCGTLGLPVYPAASPLTRGEELALAEAKCDELQRDCDALVLRVRALRSTAARAPTV